MKTVSSPEHAAALRLEATAAARLGHTTEPSTPLLIEGILVGRYLTVRMPDGAEWKYTLAVPEPVGFQRVLMVLIDQAAPQAAPVFQPDREGVFPYVGTASRYAVERGAAA